MKNLRKRTARILNRIANRLSPVGEIYVNIKPTIQIKNNVRRLQATRKAMR